MDTQAVTIFQETVKYNGNYVFVKPICDFFGIDYTNQLKRINESPLTNLESDTKVDKDIFGDSRERVVLSKDGFLIWTLQLNSDIIEESIREKFILFQKYIFAYLFGSKETRKLFAENMRRLSELYVLVSDTKRNLKTYLAEIKELEKIKEDYIKTNIIQTSLKLE
jgi:hypothetical protein